MRIASLAFAATVLAATSGPALAGPPAHAPAWGQRANEAQVTPIVYRRDRDRHRGYQGRIWRDDEGRYRCRREDGTVGLLIGGAAGALVGREIDGGRDRTVGTIVGAAAGALIGREIDRSDSRCE
ncbi:glycine zipper 2TM domain-containing protein [Parasphingopyxis lamellibrachiae]|uniref:17 kDa surface antigen n=1 Tax=Parasphingopyxis lamellibrachiae TaxID=680125 RepID=A0A3D9FGK4_9SPHN|nr:glycine zipper 2TM domain-containing protein [Parasphingopyxis lamellibrachiae]RED16919.1 glycine zipper 2TM protein [Parasphingopyxis lamellibrachiae]